MDVKILNFGTLNENDRPFLLNDNELSVSENIMLDSAGNLVTRHGYDLKLTLPPNAIEVVLYKSKNEIVVFSNPSNMHLRIDVFNATTYALKRYYAYDHPDTGSQRHIPIFEDVGQITEVNFTEFQNNLYFIYLIGDNPAPILKYDGYIIRSVGLPEPTNIIGSGTGYDYRIAYKTYDYSGNITYGPYSLVKNKNQIDTVDSLKNSFGYNNYAYFYDAILSTVDPVTGAEGPRLTQNQRTLNYLLHNYKAGDFLMIRADSQEKAITFAYPNQGYAFESDRKSVV